MLTPKRLVRGSYIGGQQVAAIVGMHPYQSAGDVYELAVHGDNHVDPNKPAIRRGRIVEPGLVEEARCIDGVDVARFRRDVFVQDDAVPFFAGTVDALALDEHGRVETIYEVTTCSRRSLYLWGEPNTDDAAKYKWIQCQWYMGITGARRARIFCLCTDDDDVLEYTVPRSDGAIAQLRDAAEAFWFDHILAREPPVPTREEIAAAPAAASEVMDRIFRAHGSGREINTSPAIEAAASLYIKAREAKKAAEDLMAEQAATLKAILEDATLVRAPALRVSWTRNKPSVDVDHEAIVAELAKALPDELVAEVRAKHTTEKGGYRVLRVTETAAGKTPAKGKTNGRRRQEPPTDSAAADDDEGARAAATDAP